MFYTSTGFFQGSERFHLIVIRVSLNIILHAGKPDQFSFNSNDDKPACVKGFTPGPSVAPAAKL